MRLSRTRNFSGFSRDFGSLKGLVMYRNPSATKRTDECIVIGGIADVMRVTALRVAADGSAGLVGYYAGLAHDQERRDGVPRGPVDYYLDRDEPPGRWWGQGRDGLRLEGSVRAEQLEAVLNGCDPGSGRQLGQGFGLKSARGSMPRSPLPRACRYCGPPHRIRGSRRSCLPLTTRQ